MSLVSELRSIRSYFLSNSIQYRMKGVNPGRVRRQKIIHKKCPDGFSFRFVFAVLFPLALVLDLLLMGTFKYLDFFIGILGIPGLGLLAPRGIPFFIQGNALSL